MEHWSSYIFQYTVGGAVFLLALWLGTRHGDDRVIWRGGKWGRGALIGGLAAYALGHAVWIALAVWG